MAMPMALGPFMTNSLPTRWRQGAAGWLPAPSRQGDSTLPATLHDYDAAPIAHVRPTAPRQRASSSVAVTRAKPQDVPALASRAAWAYPPNPKGSVMTDLYDIAAQALQIDSQPANAEEVGSFTLKVTGRTYQLPDGRRVYCATKIKTSGSVELLSPDEG